MAQITREANSVLQMPKIVTLSCFSSREVNSRPTNINIILRTEDFPPKYFIPVKPSTLYNACTSTDDQAPSQPLRRWDI